METMAAAPKMHDPSHPSKYEQWMRMREDLPSGLPKEKAGLQFYYQHLAELQNAQFVECHADAGLKIRDVQIPVTYKEDNATNNSESSGTHQEDPFSHMSLPLSDPSTSSHSSTATSTTSTTGPTIPIRIYTPTYAPPPFQLILWFHKGAYLAGDLDTEDSTCRNIARLSSSVVLNIGYRTERYPTPLRDGWDALLWAIANSSSLNASPHHRGFVVGGSAHGAHLATTLALHATDIGLNPPLTGQLLRCPVTLHPDSPLNDSLPPASPSTITTSPQSDHPLITREHVQLWWDMYNPPSHLISSPSVSPLLAGLNGLPPTYFQVTTADPYADEGLAYAAKLRADGVPTRVSVYEGEPHLFWDLPRIQGAAAAMQDLIEGLGWLQKQGQLDLGEWDTGIREEEEGRLAQWKRAAGDGEGVPAWRRKKLCQVAGCGCYM